MQQRIRCTAQKKNNSSNISEGGISLSPTNSSEEDSSIKSNLSTASSSSSPSPSSPALSTKLHPQSVRFSVVQVREFDRTVGENPACKAGPPLSLDWSFVERPEEWLFDTHSNAHADDKSDHQKIKRTLQELHVSAERRIELLRDEWDISESELAASMHVVNEIQKSRQKVVMEFRQMMALKRQQQEQAAQESDSSSAEFPVTRLEC